MTLMMLQNGYDQNADYDLIVIGSGPSGCAAALNSIKYGLSVLIITSEEANKPTDHYCPSESIHPGVMALIEHIQAEHCIAKAVTGNYHGISTNGNTHYFTNENHEKSNGFHLNKSIFSSELLQLASDRNISVLANESVTGFMTTAASITGVKTSTGKEIRAKYVIDASGSKKIGGRILKPEERFHSPPLLAWSGKITGIPVGFLTENHISQFIPKNDGWIWIAPEDHDSCTFTCLSVKGKNKIQIPDVLRGIGICHDIASFNVRWRSYKTVATEGLIICGDAGAVFDPAAGQGILNALYSGIKAAEAVFQSISFPEKECEFLEAYNIWFSGETERKMVQLSDYYAVLGVVLKI